MLTMLRNGLKKKKKHSKHASGDKDRTALHDGSLANGSNSSQFQPSRSSLLNIDDDDVDSSRRHRKKQKTSSSLRASIESAVGKSLLPDGTEEAEEIDEIEVLRERKRAREHDEKKREKKRRRKEEEEEERREIDDLIKAKLEKKGKKRKRSSTYDPDSEIVRQEWNGISGGNDIEEQDVVMENGYGSQDKENEESYRPGPWSAEKKRINDGAAEEPDTSSEQLASRFDNAALDDDESMQMQVHHATDTSGYVPESEPPVPPENFRANVTRFSNDSGPMIEDQPASQENVDFTNLFDQAEESMLPSSSEASGPTEATKQKKKKDKGKRQPLPSSRTMTSSASVPPPKSKPARVRKSDAAFLFKAPERESNSRSASGSSTAGLFMDPTPKIPRKKPSTTSFSQQSQKQPLSEEDKARKRVEEAKVLLEHRKSLPIWDYADEIRAKLMDSNTLVLIGDTGSGKSTQIGQFMLDEPWFGKRQVTLPDGLVKDGRGARRWIGGCIAITQPRRVAATNLAKRVAQEAGTELGRGVGYSIRFDSNVSTDTKIKYVTDGMLLKEILRDPLLLRYDAVVVDEAHERSLNTDLGLGFLKQMVETRERAGIPLKLVVMSATLDETRMARYVGASPPPSDSNDESAAQAPVCKIPGKLHRVNVLSSSEPVEDYNLAIIQTITQINEDEPLPGDVLVFLPGQDDIDAVAEVLQEEIVPAQEEAGYPKLVVRRLYAALGQAEQTNVFAKAPDGCRKIILATNIAETSVTVTGVRHVIDSGFCKMKKFRPELGIDSLLTVPISKASATQRKGRAGREGPGKCYRLYTDKSHHNLKPTTDPEILNCDIASAILTLKARDVEDIFNFPFLDPPPREAMERGLMKLLLLGALDDTGNITDIGRRMAEFPLPPTDARILLGAADPGADVVLEVIDILACLNVESIFRQIPQNPRGNKFKKRSEYDDDDDEEAANVNMADRVVHLRRAFIRTEGDHLTYLTLLRKYGSLGPAQKKIFCNERLLNISALNKALDTRRQLRNMCKLQKLLPDRENPYESNTTEVNYPPLDTATADKVLKVFVGAMVTNTAQRWQDGKFRTLGEKGRVEVTVHPTSTLKDSIEQERQRTTDRRKGGKSAGGQKVEDEKAGQAILFQEIVWTTKPFARCVSRVDPKWINDAGCIEGFQGLS